MCTENEIKERYNDLMHRLDMCLPYLGGCSDDILDMDLYHYFDKINIQSVKGIFNELECLYNDYLKHKRSL